MPTYCSVSVYSTITTITRVIGMTYPKSGQTLYRLVRDRYQQHKPRKPMPRR